MPNVHSPKRSSGVLDDPSSERARANSKDGRVGGDHAFSGRRQLILRGRVGIFAANEEDFRHAALWLMARWPAREVLCGRERPGPHIGHQICDCRDFRNLPPTHSSTRAEGSDPLAVAVEAECATIAHRHKFKTLDESRDLECPSADSHFQVQEFPNRRFHGNANRT